MWEEWLGDFSGGRKRPGSKEIMAGRFQPSALGKSILSKDDQGLKHIGTFLGTVVPRLTWRDRHFFWNVTLTKTHVIEVTKQMFFLSQKFCIT